MLTIPCSADQTHGSPHCTHHDPRSPSIHLRKQPTRASACATPHTTLCVLLQCLVTSNMDPRCRALHLGAMHDVANWKTSERFTTHSAMPPSLSRPLACSVQQPMLNFSVLHPFYQSPSAVSFHRLCASTSLTWVNFTSLARSSFEDTPKYVEKGLALVALPASQAVGSRANTTKEPSSSCNSLNCSSGLGQHHSSSQSYSTSAAAVHQQTD